ncbi:MAG TPA: hypothetical protein VFM58_09690, partial [Solirubrobacteraceae bacterium]|nr:hypothetical protein [Solirubrobacteraceae bacterium]
GPGDRRRPARRRGGRDVYVDTLRRVGAYAPAFDAYWASEVAPLLSAGRRPPIGAGFSAFIRADTISRAANEHLRREPELEVEHARELAAALISDGLLVALHAHGWSVEAPPAEPVLCCRGDDRVPPHAVVDDLREGRLSAGAWRERAQRLGIAGLRLSVAVAR